MNARSYFFLFFLIFYNAYLGAGFAAGTKIKVGNEYKNIELIKVGDSVTSIDINTGKVCLKKVLGIQKKLAPKTVHITTNTQTIICDQHQKFCIYGSASYWKRAQQLRTAQIFVADKPQFIEKLALFDEEIALFDLYIEDFHTFFITPQEILVHNFIPIVIGLSWAFGAGGSAALVEFMGTSVGIALLGAYLNFKVNVTKKNDNSQFKITTSTHDNFSDENYISIDVNGFLQQQILNHNPFEEITFSTKDSTIKKDQEEEKSHESNNSNGSQDPQDPNNGDNDKDDLIKTVKSLGFKKTNYYSHGQAVFQKGKKFITRDIDSHNGGFWKMANSVANLVRKQTRLGTYDKFLTRIGD